MKGLWLSFPVPPQNCQSTEGLTFFVLENLIFENKNAFSLNRKFYKNLFIMLRFLLMIQSNYFIIINAEI